MFLLYINNISENLTLHIKLFADDCIMYRPIISTEDSLHLQNNLERVFEWTHHWQIQLNIPKCVALQCTQPHSPKISNYAINGHFLELKPQHSNVSWTDN